MPQDLAEAARLWRQAALSDGDASVCAAVQCVLGELPPTARLGRAAGRGSGGALVSALGRAGP